MTTKEVGKEAKSTYNAIMQEREMFTDKQWRYYLSEIVRKIMGELNTCLWEESDIEEWRNKK